MSIATKGITVAGWCLLGSVAVAVLASFLPWYSISILGLTASANAWNSIWWIPTVIALGVAIVYVLGALNEHTVSPKARLALPIAGLVSFVLTLLILLYILASGTNAVQFGYSDSMLGETGVSAGPSFGLFLALLATGATAYFAAVAAQESGAKLPFRVRGPR